MDDLVSLLRILPDGLSVTAVIIVVILFLKYINELQTAYAKTIDEIKEGFKAEVQHITDTIGNEYKEVQKDVAKLLTDLLTIGKDHIKIQERIAQAIEKGVEKK